MKRLEGWTYLCGVSQEPEADIIVGLLNDNDIAALKDYPAAGEFLKVAYGITSGVDIFVPEPEIERARKLLENFQGPNMYEEDEEDEEVTVLQTGETREQELEDCKHNLPTHSVGKQAKWSVLIIVLIALLGIALMMQHKLIF